MVFPLAALLAIAARQASKPVSSFVKNRALQSTIFKKYVCIPPAKVYNNIEARIGLVKELDVITKQEEEELVHLGANILGEATVFLMFASLILYQYLSYSTKQNDKENGYIDRMDHLDKQITHLNDTMEHITGDIKVLRILLGDKISEAIRSD